MRALTATSASALVLLLAVALLSGPSTIAAAAGLPSSLFRHRREGRENKNRAADIDCPSSDGNHFVCRGQQTCCGAHTTTPSCCADGTNCCLNPTLPNNHTCCAPDTTCCYMNVVGTTCCNWNEVCGANGVGCLPRPVIPTPAPTPTSTSHTPAPPTTAPPTPPTLCGSQSFFGTAWTGHPFGLGWIGAAYSTLTLSCAQASLSWQHVTDNEVLPSIRVGCTPGNTTWGTPTTNFVMLGAFDGAVSSQTATLTCPQPGAFFVFFSVASTTPIPLAAMARGGLTLADVNINGDRAVAQDVTPVAITFE